MIKCESKSLPPSKSLYNRALILQSFFPNLMISTESDFEAGDVIALKTALEDFAAGKTEFDCAAGAGPLRFLAIRLTRENGSFTLRGSERLFARPHDDLDVALKALGCQDVKWDATSVSFRATGQWPTKMEIDVSSTSQVLSGILLSSWNLESPMELIVHGIESSSKSYAEMTFQVVAQSGWQGNVTKKDKVVHVEVPKKQQLVLDEFMIEPDMSCAAVLALIGASTEGIRFWSIPVDSLQGDYQIFTILQEMGVKIISSPLEFPMGYQNLRVEAARTYRGIEVDLASTPDLFPVLAAFCAKANSPSKLRSLHNLNKKESRRLDQMRELLKRAGVNCEIVGDDFKIFPVLTLKDAKFDYDPDEDHRLAMAAALLNKMGASIKIQNPKVVEKSFPNFWEIGA